MMMGKTFQIALLTMLATAPATAQTLTSLANAPREGDRLELLPVAVPDVGEAGRDRLWDFSDLRLLDGKLKVEHLLRSDTTDTLMAIARRTRHYSVLRGDTLLSPGTENNLWLIRYTLPETLLRFPFAYGDSLAAPFLGTSQYCERTYHRTYGLSTIKADALGTLVTPDGDTLRHVLRVRTLRTEGARTLPVYTEPDMRRLLATLPPFIADSVHARLAADTLPLTTVTYRFFAPGYRYPVLTVTTEGMGGESVSEALYLSPEEQELLAYDPVNERLRDIVADMDTGGGRMGNSGGSSRLLAQGGGFDPLGGNDGSALSSYSLTLDADGQSARLAFHLSKDASFSAGIHTGDGKTVWLLPERIYPAGGHSAAVDLSRCTRGVYVLTLRDDGNINTVKLTIK